MQDAELSVELGAWAIGLNFYDASPRSCSLEQAGVICAALRRRVELCGVFVNAPLPRMVQVCRGARADARAAPRRRGTVVLCEVARRTGARIIKAAQVSGSADIRDLERFHVDFHLLDARSRATGREGMRGGTGETFDWGLVAERRSRVPSDPERRPDRARTSHAPWRRPGRTRSTPQADGGPRPGRKDPAKLARLRRARRRRTRGRAAMSARRHRWSSIASGPTEGSTFPRR